MTWTHLGEKLLLDEIFIQLCENCVFCTTFSLSLQPFFYSKFTFLAAIKKLKRSQSLLFLLKLLLWLLCCFNQLFSLFVPQTSPSSLWWSPCTSSAATGAWWSTCWSRGRSAPRPRSATTPPWRWAPAPGPAGLWSGTSLLGLLLPLMPGVLIFEWVFCWRREIQALSIQFCHCSCASSGSELLNPSRASRGSELLNPSLHMELGMNMWINREPHELVILNDQVVIFFLYKD